MNRISLKMANIALGYLKVVVRQVLARHETFFLVLLFSVMSDTKAPSAEDLAAVKMKNAQTKRERLSMRRRTRPLGRAAVVMARRSQKQSVSRVFFRRMMSTLQWPRPESSRIERRVGRSAEQFAVIVLATPCVSCCDGKQTRAAHFDV